MNVLIACEESQRVCGEFRRLGHNAFSCDIEICSGEHLNWHIQHDVLDILNGGNFTTSDGVEHEIDKWDLIIAHPPCTYLCVSGNRWFNVERYGMKAIERYKLRDKAVEFFMTIAGCNCEHIAIENPIGVMSTIYRKPDQIIQPYMFNDPVRKATCLWLKNLPPLTPTGIVEPNIVHYTCKNGKHVSFSDYMVRNYKASERSKHRSKTFPGIAQAMAEQWSEYLKEVL